MKNIQNKYSRMCRHGNEMITQIHILGGLRAWIWRKTVVRDEATLDDPPSSIEGDSNDALFVTWSFGVDKGHHTVGIDVLRSFRS